MKRKRLKTLGIIFILFILALVLVSYVYLSNYYHSTNSFEGYQSESDIPIISDDSFIVVGNVDDAKAGVIIYPGGKVEYTSYIPLANQIAAQGYACFIVKMPFNLAVFGINKADNVIEKNLQIDKWYIGGHSLGGAMASEYAIENVDKLKGLFLLGAYPSSDLSNTDLKLLSIVGSEDKVLNKETYEENKAYAPELSEYVEIYGGNHAYYGDYGEQAGDGKAKITREEQIYSTSQIILDWLSV